MSSDTPEDNTGADNDARIKPGTDTEVYTNRFKKKWDWERIREYFIMGIPEELGNGKDREARRFLNLPDTAKHWKIPLPTLQQKAAKERWYDQRRSYQHDLEGAKRSRRISELQSESVDFDSSALKTAKLGVSMVSARMAEIAQDYQERKRVRDAAIERARQGGLIDPGELATVIDGKELDTLARAASQWHALGQRALGLDVQRHEITGTDGQPIEVSAQVSVTEELERDNPDRLASFITVVQRTPGLFELLTEQHEDIIDGEIVEGDDDEDTGQTP